MTSSLRVTLIAALVLGCGGRSRPSDDIFDEVPADHPLVGYEGWFLLHWNGARVGDAHERFRRRADARGGFQLTRTETVAIARGGELVRIETELVIDTTDELEARRVRIEQRSGDVHLVGTATHAPDGWTIQWGDAPIRRAPADAVPLALVPLRNAITPADYRGPVLLEGYGFAEARLELERVGATSLRADLITRFGATSSTVELRPDGTVERIAGVSGEVRASRGEVARSFPAVDVIDRTTIPLGVEPPPGPIALELGPIARALPPALPGQRIRADGDRWRLELDPTLAPPAPDDVPVEAQPQELEKTADELLTNAVALTPMAELRALATAVAGIVDDSYAAPTGSARAALDAGRGDCTTHAILFRALAAARGIPTRLVTGFRIDGGRLVRHRWVIAAVEGAWVAVDPTYGEAPAAPRLIGLSVHDGADHELALADEFTFTGTGDAAARLVSARR